MLRFGSRHLCALLGSFKGLQFVSESVYYWLLTAYDGA
jgi:hypothetical protein